MVSQKAAELAGVHLPIPIIETNTRAFIFVKTLMATKLFESRVKA